MKYIFFHLLIATYATYTATYVLPRVASQNDPSNNPAAQPNHGRIGYVVERMYYYWLVGIMGGGGVSRMTLSDLSYSQYLQGDEQARD